MKLYLRSILGQFNSRMEETCRPTHSQLIFYGDILCIKLFFKKFKNVNWLIVLLW